MSPLLAGGVACWTARACLIAVVCWASLLPATAGKTEDILLGIEDLQQQMLLLTREQARAAESLAKIERRVGEQADSVHTVQADLLQKVDVLIEEMHILRQRLEDTGSRLVQLTQEMRRNQNGAPAAVPGGSGSDVRPAVSSDSSPNQVFSGAYADFSKGNYQLALWGFQDFLRKFPSDPRASDALYWIAECHLSQNEYAKAVAEFDRLIQQYTTRLKVAASYLKKGLALLEASQVAQAVVQLQHVVQNYPHSDEAHIARQRLEGLGLR
ncbi:MAG: tetratricopeptide repeat protein [Acidobacteriota bacterium]